jgi:hypothetical protein
LIVNHTHNDRDVAAPRAAVAWASGAGPVPGRWLYDEQSVALATSNGETVWRTEIDPRTDRAWLRDVRGHASQADLIHLVTDVDQLRTTLIDLAEEAAQALSSHVP